MPPNFQVCFIALRCNISVVKFCCPCPVPHTRRATFDACAPWKRTTPSRHAEVFRLVGNSLNLHMLIFSKLGHSTLNCRHMHMFEKSMVLYEIWACTHFGCRPSQFCKIRANRCTWWAITHASAGNVIVSGTRTRIQVLPQKCVLQKPSQGSIPLSVLLSSTGTLVVGSQDKC